MKIDKKYERTLYARPLYLSSSWRHGVVEVGGSVGCMMTVGIVFPSRVLSEGGVEGVLTEETPPLSRISSEGGGGGGDGSGVSTENPPPPSRVSSEGGEGGLTKEATPPSRVSSEGGVWWWCVDRRNTPSVSRFERGREWRGWMQQHDEERDVSLRRVGSVEVSKLN